MNNKKSSSSLYLGLIVISYAVVIALAAILREVDTAFWEGLAFLTLGAAVGAAMVLIYGSRANHTDIFFHMPIYVSGALYYVLAGLVSFLYMLLGFLDFKLLLILQLLLLAAFAVVTLLSLIQIKGAETATQNVKLRNGFIRTMTVRVQNLVVVADPSLTGSLEALAEEFRFSKPIAHADLAAVEADIQMSMGQLEQSVAAGSASDAQIQLIRKQLLQRNNIAKLLK